MTDKTRMTALNTSVGADDGRSLTKCTDDIITDEAAEIKDFEELQRKMRRMTDPAYLHTFSMNELYDREFDVRPPIVEGLLYPGTYILAGASKVGKSFLVAQIAYHVSTGKQLWEFPVHQCGVLYLALEDDQRRLQSRLARMFGVKGTDALSFAISSQKISFGLETQLDNYLRENPKTQLIIIDTLQKVRMSSGDIYSYADDYETIGKLKQFTDARGICVLVGKGSVNHNSRKFKAANVDPERTHLNVEYCNEPIKQVYHKLFDEALERYNAKQTRSDRRIDDYYEKIRTGKQEKPFHELIIQIGNRDDTGSGTEIGKQAKAALNEYFQGFRERNPNLYVFSAHLHMDEATPHIHIDFVPFTTGSKRGLDARVSLKQALAAQGFRGGTRGATEWNQWVLSEKKELAIAMFRHGFEWEQKGTHEEHLSVIDYKKQERTKELVAVEEKLADRSAEFNTLAKRINNLEDGEQSYHDMEEKLVHDPEYQLPEPQGLMSAKTYKAKFAEPLIQKLKEMIKSLIVQCAKIWDSYHRINERNGRLYKENEHLIASNDRLKEKNVALREQNKDYALLRKVFGSRKIDDLVTQAREAQQAKRRQRQRSYDYER